MHLAGWVYCHIYNVMQYHNTALDTTALVMHDSNTFIYGFANFILCYDNTKVSSIALVICNA